MEVLPEFLQKGVPYCQTCRQIYYKPRKKKKRKLEKITLFKKKVLHAYATSNGSHTKLSSK